MQSAAGHGTSKEHPHQKKMSSALIVFVACVVGLAIGLFSLNYWHTSRCATERSAAELDEMIDSLHKRLLESESMVRNLFLSLSLLNSDLIFVRSKKTRYY